MEKIRLHHVNPRPNRAVRIALSVVIAAALVAATTLIWTEFSSDWAINPESSEREVFKIGLQFLMVTVLGGALFALVSLVRDDRKQREDQDREAEKARDQKFSQILALETKLGEVYRAMKVCRRRLRSRVPFTSGGPPWTIDQEPLDKSLEEVLLVQIGLEALDDDLPLRTDLFAPRRIERLSTIIHYASRYLHGVYEDYEKRRVQRSGGNYFITPECTHLVDFVYGGSGELEMEIGSNLSRLRDETLSPDERLAALHAINAVRKAAKDGIRYSAVALQCFKLAAAELRDAAVQAGPVSSSSCGRDWR